MLDANTEINGLRQRLRLKNLSESVCDQICDEASNDISSQTSDVLADAMNQAINAGGDIMSTEFIDELKSIRSGNGFDIITASGQTDFSEPPFPMLPKLLKNAKIAKDGSLYKVIPIRMKSNATPGRVAVTTEAALQNINDARFRAKEEREAEKESSRSLSPDAMKGGDIFSTMMSLNTSRTKQVRERSTEPVIAFKTASSKQDPNTQWVHPGKTKNMSGELREINMNMHDSIDRIIQDTIRVYEDMY